MNTIKNCSNSECPKENPQPVANFNKRSNRPSGKHSICKTCESRNRKMRNIDNPGAKAVECNKWRKNNPQKSKSSWLKYKYGITIEEYDNMLFLQNYSCAICLRPRDELKKDLAVDHDHETNTIRGLLCGKCNKGLGLFRDSSSLLKDAATYIEYYKETK